MNPELPGTPREALELKITALLLGELDAAEADHVRQAIAADPELTKLHDQLKQTLGLVKAASSDLSDSSDSSEPLHLSENKRNALLTHFKVIKPAAFQRSKRPSSSIRLIEVAAVLAILAVVAAMLLPSLAKSKAKAQRITLLNNLKQIDLAKQMWAQDNEVPAGTVPAREDLEPYLGYWPQSVEGEVYVVGDVSQPVVAEMDTKPSRGLARAMEKVQAANGTEVYRSIDSSSRDWRMNTSEAPSPAPTEIPVFESVDLLATDQKRRIQSASQSASRSERTKLDIALPTQSSSEEALYAYGGTDGDYAKWGLTADDRTKQINQPAAGTAWYGRFANSVGADKPVESAEGALGVATASEIRTRGLDETLLAGAKLSDDHGAVTTTRPAPVVDFKRDLMAEHEEELNSRERHFAETTDAIALPAVEEAQPTILLRAMSGAVEGTDWDSSGSRGYYNQVRDLAGKETAAEDSLATFGDSPVAGRLFGSEPSSGSDRTSSTKALAEAQSGLEQRKYASDAEVRLGFAGNYDVEGLAPAKRPGTSGGSRQSGQVMGGNGVVDAIEDGQKLNHFFNDRYYAGYAVAAGETEEPSRLERETPSPTPGESLAMAGQFDGVVQTDGEDFRYKVGGLGGGQKVELGDRFDIALPQRPKDDNLRIEESTPSPGAKIAGISTVTGVPRAFVKAKPSPRRVTGDGVALQQGSGRVPQVGASRGSSGMEERAVTKTSTHLTTNIPLAYASPSNVESALRHMLADERSELVVDADRNRLQITGTEDEIKQAEALVSQLDAPTRQVLIKAKIIESNSGTVDLWAYTPPEDKAVKPGLKEGEQRVKTKAAPPPRKPSADAPTPQPEVQTAANAFSTFSLNVSDVSFKLAAASLEQGQMPDAATVRSEEFLNAFNYRDPAPAPGQPLAFAWERARYPFAHNRDLLRFSVQTAARGREPGRPLNLVLLLDNSGSMERADRVSIIRECLNVLAGQLTAQDTISVVTFARTARLWLDGVPGVQAAASLATAGQLTPEGGTNLEEAMKLAYATAHRHYLPDGVNRVVLLTDGAANLGNIDPDSLKGEVEAQRRQGIALDCFGIGWEGYNDDVLEVLSRNGDGRYGFVNTPQAASTEFAAQLAGALQVAASDVKVQVEFNPARVTAYRQIGYAKHQLKKEQFRDNTVDAAEIGAAESGNALYVVETNPRGQGPVATVRARFKVPATGEYKESQWTVPYTGEAVALDNASEAMRLAASASAFSEWLLSSPYAGEVTTDRLLSLLRGVPEVFGADSRPRKLGWMIREAGRIAGN